MKKRISVLCITIMLAIGTAYAADYTGNNMLVVLGTPKTSQQFTDFKTFWALNAKNESPVNGIKVNVNAGDRVESLVFSNDYTDATGTHFQKCKAKLPFGLSMDDDVKALEDKLGDGERLTGKNGQKFYQKSIAVEAVYTDPKKGYKLLSLTIYVDRTHAATAGAGGKRFEQASVSSSSIMTPFKRSILDVFKAWKESYFSNIKADARYTGNYWNYKYTYRTKLKIPGEMYNMLYSYPFASSSPDFVVVLKESDTYDQSFETTYHAFEKQLMESFPAGEGWISSCIPNEPGAKMSDLELRNDRFGAVVLDYCKNPHGRYVLYLRFLLYS